MRKRPIGPDPEETEEDCLALFYDKRNAAGFLADLVHEALTRTTFVSRHKVKLQRAARIIVREARRDHDKADRRGIAVRVGRLLGNSLPVRPALYNEHFTTSYSMGAKGSMEALSKTLGIAATVLIDPDRKVHKRLMDPIIETLEAFGMPDAYFDEAGIRWKIRDWGGDRVPIPPHIRQAVAAAWEVDAMELARDIVERYVEEKGAS